MDGTPLALLLAYIVAAGAIFWLVGANLAALSRYRAALGRKPSATSLAAWMLSLAAVWAGPAVVIGAAIAITLGTREQRRVERGEAPRRSKLPAEMAVKNSVVLLVASALVALLVFLGWRA